MWLRTALLLIFWLLVYRLVIGVLRQLSRLRSGNQADRGSKPQAEPRRAEWEPSDVIDVPFHEVRPESGRADAEHPESRAAGHRDRSSSE